MSLMQRIGAIGRSYRSQLTALGRGSPLGFAVLVATGKTAAADLLTQRCIEQRSELDRRRLAFFTFFGCTYLGFFQYYLYVRCFGRWFPHASRFAEAPTLAARLSDRAGLRDLWLQVAAGNFVHIPFVFLPSFYCMQEICERGRAASMSTALEKYAANARADLLAAWQIWIPGHAVFMSVPMWLRLPTNHALSFLYVCVLSFSRGQVASTERATGSETSERSNPSEEKLEPMRKEKLERDLAAGKAQPRGSSDLSQVMPSQS